MKIDRACYERGCACYDDRIDKDLVEVVKREWVGLTDEDILDALRPHYEEWEAIELDRKSTRLNSSHMSESRMPSSA